MSYRGKHWEFYFTCACGFDVKVHSGQASEDKRRKRDTAEAVCAGCGTVYAIAVTVAAKEPEEAAA